MVLEVVLKVIEVKQKGMEVMRVAIVSYTRVGGGCSNQWRLLGR